jgi:hypothetical protein
MENKSKIHYDIDSVISEFNIVNVSNCESLNSWMQAQGVLSAYQIQELEDLRQLLLDEGRGWNEEELKISFIGPLFHIAKPSVKGVIRIFYERPLSAVINNIKLSVKCDCMLATPKGYGTPIHPYFFMQEFKRQKGDDHDPEAQMLSAMLIAQELNNDNQTLYGAWLQGRFWYFTTLNGRDYCQSEPLDAGNKHALLQIVFMLRKLKDIILNR